MITERKPAGVRRRLEYERSDALSTLPLPEDDRLRRLAREVETALESGKTAPVKSACAALTAESADFYGIRRPKIRVLASRPLRVWETGSSELFGDYDPRTAVIRVWMRTAVQHRVTSFGTFISTLCHEFCHHLDIEALGLPASPHTRGFYERTAVLYHHCRGTPLRRLVWRYDRRGFWRIDWGRMRSGIRYD